MAARYLREFADREPTVVISVILGGIGIGCAIVVPPIRRDMGLPTDQMDGFKPWRETKSAENRNGVTYRE